MLVSATELLSRTALPIFAPRSPTFLTSWIGTHGVDKRKLSLRRVGSFWAPNTLLMGRISPLSAVPRSLGRPCLERCRLQSAWTHSCWVRASSVLSPGPVHSHCKFSQPPLSSRWKPRGSEKLTCTRSTKLLMPLPYFQEGIRRCQTLHPLPSLSQISILITGYELRGKLAVSFKGSGLVMAEFISSRSK